METTGAKEGVHTWCSSTAQFSIFRTVLCCYALCGGRGKAERSHVVVDPSPLHCTGTGPTLLHCLETYCDRTTPQSDHVTPGDHHTDQAYSSEQSSLLKSARCRCCVRPTPSPYLTPYTDVTQVMHHAACADELLHCTGCGLRGVVFSTAGLQVIRCLVAGVRVWQGSSAVRGSFKCLIVGVRVWLGSSATRCSTREGSGGAMPCCRCEGVAGQFGCTVQYEGVSSALLQV